MRRLVYLLATCLCLAPAVVSAQDVNNPSGVTFTASTDHATDRQLRARHPPA
jgi:hypothetical protein